MRPYVDPRSIDRRHGFTLLELLLALGITAVMGSSVYLVYANAVRIDRESRRLGDVTFDSFMVVRTLERDLGRLVYYRYAEPGETTEQAVFEADDDRLAFVIQDDDGLKWVEYLLVQQPQDQVRSTQLGQRTKGNVDMVVERSIQQKPRSMFLRKLQLFKGRTPAGDEDIRQEILTDNIASDGLEFYYAEFKQNNGLSWSKTWKQSARPAALRVVLRLLDPDSGRTFEISKDLLMPTGM
jgi:prepilin-type N-terminal cleavage/methylation domain-containing protein